MLDVERMLLLRDLDELGSMAAVALERHISASAVSQQLRKLEIEAGMPLLRRAGRGVQLTRAGERLAERASELRETLELAEADVAAARAGVDGVVRIGCLMTVASAVLPGIVTALAEAHPSLRVEASTLEPEGGVAALESRRIDVLVTDEYPGLQRSHGHGLDWRTAVIDPISVCMPVGSEGVAPQDVPWVMEPPESDAARFTLGRCRAAGFEPVVRYTSTDLALHRQLVEAGLAAAFLPALVLSAAPETRPAASEAFSRDLERMLFTVVRAGSRTRPAVDAVCAAVDDALERAVGAVGG